MTFVISLPFAFFAAGGSVAKIVYRSRKDWEYVKNNKVSSIKIIGVGLLKMFSLWLLGIFYVQIQSERGHTHHVCHN